MSGMNEYLAAHYGTLNSTSTAVPSEDLEKQAQVELFSKLAAENGIELETLPEDQVTKLWNDFQKNASGESAEKVAEFPPKKEEDKEEKDEKMDEAKKEHEEKKASAEKLAEADFLGRVMAHSYVDELKKIAAEQTKTATPVEPVVEAVEETKEETKEAGGLPPWLASAKNKAKDVAGKAGLGAGLVGQKVKHEVGQAAGKAKEKGKEVGLKALGKANEHKGHAAAAAGGAAVGAGATAATMHKKEKKASAIDQLACESALLKCAEAGYDLDEATTRLGAVLELPASESTKIASIQDLSAAIEVRGLELLEMAGYPVSWNDEQQ